MKEAAIMLQPGLPFSPSSSTEHPDGVCLIDLEHDYGCTTAPALPSLKDLCKHQEAIAGAVGSTTSFLEVLHVSKLPQYAGSFPAQA